MYITKMLTYIVDISRPDDIIAVFAHPNDLIGIGG